MPTVIRRYRIPQEPENSIRVGSVRTFLSELEKVKVDKDHVLFYRGHSKFNYSLSPSIYRNSGWIANEDILFKELILRCPDQFGNSDSTFQTLVRMQHYSLPTRLLDITTNPLIAVYFASASAPATGLRESGEVVIFKVPKTEIKYFDSDTVSVISNISRRPSSFKVPRAPFPRSGFNGTPEIKFLLHGIKKEKPYFEPYIDPKHLESVVFVKPKLDNARIIRQDGAFILFGITEVKKNPAIVPTKHLVTPDGKRLLVSGEEKKTIRDQLEILGVTQGTIYPEIERVAEYIKSVYQE